MTERLIKWQAGVVWSHVWFATCPTCGSVNSEIIQATHRFGGVQTTTRCNTCLYEWGTGVYGEESNAYFLNDDEYAPEDEYYVWHDDAYQQSHPEEYPELWWNYGEGEE